MLKIKNRLIIPIICLVYGIISPAFAQDSSIITSISDKMVISVQNSNITYELSDTYIPKIILADTVKKANELSQNMEFTFSNVGSEPGRHGSFYASVTKLGNQKSLQEELLENGLCLVYFIESSTNSATLFAAEDRARKANLGIWKAGFSVRDSKAIAKDYKHDLCQIAIKERVGVQGEDGVSVLNIRAHSRDRSTTTSLKDCSLALGQFIIVSGVVNNIYSSKKNTYVNFGEDWQTDFTIQFESKILKNFPEFSAEKLKGKTISVRGWLEDYNGPFMKIYHPANIQIIQGN